MKDIKIQVFEFIKKTTGVTATENTLIFNDLELDGIEAEWFIDKFAECFGVNMTGFNQYDYSTPDDELLNIFKALYIRLFTKKTNKIDKFPVSHLIAVAEKKEWFPPT